MLIEPLLDIMDPRIEKMVVQIAFKGRRLPMDIVDIQQEFRLALIIYFNETPDISKRSLGAVRNTINRKLYSLIKKHVTHEGCCEKTRKTRRDINTPFSIESVISNNLDMEYGNSVVEKMLLDHRVEHCASDLATQQILDMFMATLNKREMVIFDAMLDGIRTPRAICESLGFPRDEKSRKIVSKELNDLKNRFERILKDA